MKKIANMSACLAFPIKTRHTLIESRAIDSIVRALGSLSERWLKKDYYYRKKALKQLVDRSHFSPKMSEAIIDAIFSELTQNKLKKLLKIELGDPRVLDEFRPNTLTGYYHKAEGPQIITHVLSGNVPQPSIVSVVLGMLLRSINIIKLSSKDEGFLRWYLASVKITDRELGSLNLIIDQDHRLSFREILRRSDLLIAYGCDDTIRVLQRQLSHKTRLIAYGHRESFGLYFKEALKGPQTLALAKRAATDIWMADQRGCLSPGVLFIEQDNEKNDIQRFFNQLCLELEKRSLAKDAVSVNQADRSRAYYARINEFKVNTLGSKIAFWKRGQSQNSWIAFCDDNLNYLPQDVAHQVVIIKVFNKIESVLKIFEKKQNVLQAVALEQPHSGKRRDLALKLAGLGFNRVCRAGQMQTPSINWHHDGRPNLASWVRWTDLEA